MKIILNYISDFFVFWNLKKISNGYLNLIDSKGKSHFFGDDKSFLRAKIKINNPSFCYKILTKGSTGLGESYMNGDFETENLTSLIELSREEAIMQSRDYGIELLEDGYQFLEYIPTLESWKITTNDNLFRERKFSPNIQYDLFIENNAIEINQKQSDPNNIDELNLERVPHILILSSGDLNPFSLRLFRDVNNILEIVALIDGTINVNE